MIRSQAFDSVQDLIKAGRQGKARAAVQQLLREPKIPRADRLRLAYLARQVNMQEKAIALLHRVVRPRSKVSKATDEEKAEYGMALADLGASREAIEILSGLDLVKLPRIFRPLSFAYFRRWEWAEAIPLIERFLARRDLKTHDRLGAELRLGMALLHGRDDCVESRKIIDRLAAQTRPDHFPVIHHEAVLFQVQCSFLEKDWGRALEHQILLETLSGADSEYHYFPLITRQWGALTRYYATRDRAGALRELRNTRDAFAALGRWVNVRACDYYEALCLQDPKLMVRMFYSSPYPELHRKILKGFGADLAAIPLTYDWPLAGAARGQPVLKVVGGTHTLGPSALKAGQLPQRALRALTADFYKIPGVNDLFERLYPDEYFNPLSSPHRIHEAIRRLRLWLASNRIPLEIRESRESYRFHADRPIALRLSRDPGPVATAGVQLAARLQGTVSRLRERIGTEGFSSITAAAVLDVSRNTAITALSEGVAHGVIERIGDGRSTRYRLRA